MKGASSQNKGNLRSGIGFFPFFASIRTSLKQMNTDSGGPEQQQQRLPVPVESAL
jgi:hypothetical protein